METLYTQSFGFNFNDLLNITSKDYRQLLIFFVHGFPILQRLTNLIGTRTDPKMNFTDNHGKVRIDGLNFEGTWPRFRDFSQILIGGFGDLHIFYFIYQVPYLITYIYIYIYIYIHKKSYCFFEKEREREREREKLRNVRKYVTYDWTVLEEFKRVENYTKMIYRVQYPLFSKKCIYKTSYRDLRKWPKSWSRVGRNVEI